MSLSQISCYLRGTSLALAIAVLSVFIEKQFGFNVILVALVLGMLIGNVIPLNDTFNAGIKFSSNRILEFAIILMAFSIDYASFLLLGWKTILIVVSTVFFVLWTTLWLGKKFNYHNGVGLLIGFGTAICGSSAIAALSPSVCQDKSDTGIAMAVVNLYGLIGMLLLPFVTADWLTDVQNSILLGTSLHGVGNVAGAGFSMSDTIGNMAVTVKLGRVALLTPALLIFGHFTAKYEEVKTKRKLSLPWYLVAFIIISIIPSLVELPIDLLSYCKKGSNFLLATALAAIGLKVSFSTLLTSGRKGLIFGGIIFALQLIFIACLMLF